MKQIIIILLIFSTTISNAQIKFGQPISETDYFLKYLLDGKPDTELEYVYDDGEIIEIIVHQTNQMTYDLDAIVNLRTRYISKQGELNNILIQFYNLSTQNIKQQFDKRYSKHKIGDYYFTKDFGEYRVVKLVDNLASIDYRTTDNSLDIEILNEIDRRKHKRDASSNTKQVEKDTIQYQYDDSFSEETDHMDFYDLMIKNDTIYDGKLIKNRKELNFAKPNMSIRKWIIRYIDFDAFDSDVQGVVKCLIEKDGSISETEKLDYNPKLETMMLKRLDKLSFEPAQYNDDTGITVPIRSYYYLVARIKIE